MYKRQVYEDFQRDVLAIPTIPGEKTEAERFPGAEQTYTVEALSLIHISSGRVCLGCHQALRSLSAQARECFTSPARSGAWSTLEEEPAALMMFCANSSMVIDVYKRQPLWKTARRTSSPTPSPR